MGRRSKRDLGIESCGTVTPTDVDSNSPIAPGLTLSLLAIALFIVVAIGLPACVETADCDASVPCEANEVCYDFQCRRTCETNEDCVAGTVCAPCMQDDSEGTVDHCFESSASACVPEE